MPLDRRGSKALPTGRRWRSYVRSGSMQIWKVPAQGGHAAQVTKHGGFGAFESRDGMPIYYSKHENHPAVWRVPSEGGEEIEVLSRVTDPGFWALHDNGIYFIDPIAKPDPRAFESRYSFPSARLRSSELLRVSVRVVRSSAVFRSPALARSASRVSIRVSTSCITAADASSSKAMAPCLAGGV